jgi:hypothetical protein
VVQQAHRVGGIVIAAQRVGADQFGQPIALMRGLRSPVPRISERRTLKAALASCQAASDPPSPAPMM